MRTVVGSVTVIVGATLALAAAGPAPARAPCSVPLLAYHTGIVALTDGGKITRVRVQIADTAERQEIGLMCRPQLAPDEGMLFEFPVATRTSFWMKNTLIPLAIAFMDGRWRIIKIVEMPVAPDPTADDPSKFPQYDPGSRFCYALEVNSGFFKAHEISNRAEVRFVPQDGSPPSCAGGAARPPATWEGVTISGLLSPQRIGKPGHPTANTAF